MNLEVITRAEKEFTGTELAEDVVPLLDAISTLAVDLQAGEDWMTPNQIVAYLELQHEGLLAAAQGLTERIDRLHELLEPQIKASARQFLADLCREFADT